MNKSINKLNKETQDFINDNNKFIEIGDPFNKFVKSNIAGIHTFGIPFSSVNVKKVKDSNALMYPNQTVFEATYNFDKYGRRVTKSTDSVKNKVSLFFGDSQVFGEGCNDNETLPYYFENLNPNFTSYNYGFLGHGPSHMLYTVNSPAFKELYKDANGKVFYIYRDDAIKVTVGEVPWGEGYPKYELRNDELQYIGQFGGETYSPDPMYLPSMYTHENYKVTLEVFKQVQNNLPVGLELYIVIIPLSFTNYKMEEMLNSSNINVLNFYTADLEYHTNQSARFLDGVHTRHTNQYLAKRITFHLDEQIPSYNLNYTHFKTVEDVYRRLDLESIFIPIMVDFPFDDAGVIVSNILQNYIGNETINSEVLVEYLEKKYKEKFNLLLSKQVHEYCSLHSDHRLKDIILNEYLKIPEKLLKYEFTY